MRINTTGTAVSAALTAIEAFCKFARGDAKRLRVTATDEPRVSLSMETDHDRAEVSVEGATVAGIGVCQLNGAAVMERLKGLDGPIMLATRGRRLFVSKRVGMFWRAIGTFAMEGLSDQAAGGAAELAKEKSMKTAAASKTPPATAPAVTPSKTSPATAPVTPSKTTLRRATAPKKAGRPPQAKSSSTVAPPKAPAAEGDVRVTGKAFKEALGRVVFPRKSSLPALQCVKLTATEGGLTLTGTDLEDTVIETLPATVNGAWTRVVPGAELKESTKGRLSANEQISLTAVGKTDLSVQGVGRQLEISGIAAEDFPPTPVVGAEKQSTVVAFESSELPAALRSTMAAASRDEYQPALRCVSVSEDSVAATDGHRLHRRKMQEALPSMLLPSGKGLGVVKRFETVTGSTDGKHVQFQEGPVTVVMRLGQMSFPAYEKVIPKSGSSHVLKISTEDRKEFCAKLKKLPVAKGKDKNGKKKPKVVRVRINGSVELESQGDGAASGRASVPIGLENGGEVIFGCNRDYLVDALSEEVEQLHIRDAEQPLHFHGPAMDVVVMPARL